MNAAVPERPLPVPTRESQGYWDGMCAQELRLQHCTACGRVRHYPRPVCPHCLSMESEWRRAPLEGAVHCWTVCHHPFNFFFKASAPYIVALVDMDAGVRINAPLQGVADPGLRIGMRVRLVFNPVTAEVTLPSFVST